MASIEPAGRVETAPEPARGHSLAREFLLEQMPLVLLTLVAGVLAAYWQHGFLPGADAAFPIAGVRVPIWHLVWMGFWTGYTMALVGQAAGLFALPYQVSILHFSNASVTPTTQLMTLINPLGALLGFWRGRQSNWDFALWVCLGGAIGALIGPFLRMTVLADPKPFNAAVGLALAVTGIQLCSGALRGFRGGDAFEQKFDTAARQARAAARLPSGLPHDIGIETVSKERGLLTISYWGHAWTMRISTLFLLGILVGMTSSALGIGGGFLLVPIFVALYRLPMYVLVAASVPFVLVNSAMSLVTYGVIAPLLTGERLPIEWSWGLFAAGGGILGAWCAAKTQRFVPQSFLNLMLGAITAAAGAIFILGAFVALPFRI